MNITCGNSKTFQFQTQLGLSRNRGNTFDIAIRWGMMINPQCWEGSSALFLRQPGAISPAPWSLGILQHHLQTLRRTPSGEFCTAWPDVSATGAVVPWAGLRRKAPEPRCHGWKTRSTVSMVELHWLKGKIEALQLDHWVPPTRSCGIYSGGYSEWSWN